MMAADNDDDEEDVVDRVMMIMMMMMDDDDDYYYFKSRLSLIVQNRTVVVDSDRSFDNLCGSHFQSLWLWRWLPHRLSKRQSLSTTTALFRTTFTWTIKLNLLLKWLLGSNLSHFYYCYYERQSIKITIWINWFIKLHKITVSDGSVCLHSQWTFQPLDTSRKKGKTTTSFRPC